MIADRNGDIASVDSRLPSCWSYLSCRAALLRWAQVSMSFPDGRYGEEADRTGGVPNQGIASSVDAQLCRERKALQRDPKIARRGKGGCAAN